MQNGQWTMSVKSRISRVKLRLKLKDKSKMGLKSES